MRQLNRISVELDRKKSSMSLFHLAQSGTVAAVFKTGSSSVFPSSCKVSVYEMYLKSCSIAVIHGNMNMLCVKSVFSLVLDFFPLFNCTCNNSANT